MKGTILSRLDIVENRYSSEKAFCDDLDICGCIANNQSGLLRGNIKAHFAKICSDKGCSNCPHGSLLDAIKSLHDDTNDN